jgi:hypothetical protein
MIPGWKVRVRGPRHGGTTRSRHRRPGAQRCYRRLWLVGAARNERGKQERDQRGPTTADHCDAEAVARRKYYYVYTPGAPEVGLSCELRQCAEDQSWDMMISRVSPPAVSDLHPALLACPTRPVNGVQERQVAGTAARGGGTTAYPSPAPAGLGRPRRPRHVDPAPAPKPAGTPSGHTWHRPAVAPAPGHPEGRAREPRRRRAVSASDVLRVG